MVRRVLALGVLLSACPAIRLSAQCPDGTPPPCGRAVVAAVANANSVGVMLFNNQTRDSAYAYLSDGLATEIATSLARIPRLEVRSPGAVRSAQRGIEPDPRTVGRRLNVRYVVEGDFQRGGDRIRVSVRLVAVPSGTQRWSEAYTRPVADLLAVQEEIARSVATAIAGELLPQERSVLAARPTRIADAYDRFLRGNFQLARRTPAGVARAIEEYSAALRLDPSFAHASARAAVGYALFLDWGWEFPGAVAPDSLLALGMQAADYALARDSSSSDGWLARGYLLGFRHPRTLEGVLDAMRRATVLGPRNAEAWHQYGSWLTAVNRLDEASDALSRALVIEPGRPVSYLQRAQVHEIERRDRQAAVDYDSSIAADPEFYAAYFNRTWVRLRAGDIEGARADAEAAMRWSPPSEQYYGLAPMAAVAARTGDTTAARQYMARAVAPFASRGAGTLVIQVFVFGFVATGQISEALDWLDRAEPKGALLWWNLLYPAVDPLRGHPRFERVVAASRPPEAR